MPNPFFVRSLNEDEYQTLQKKVKYSKSTSFVRRAQILIESAKGKRARQIADQLHMHVRYVRSWIKEFNHKGLAIFEIRNSAGRKPSFSGELKERLSELVKLPPSCFGWKRSSWTLKMLAKRLQKEKFVVHISHESVRQILKKRK